MIDKSAELGVRIACRTGGNAGRIRNLHRGLRAVAHIRDSGDFPSGIPRGRKRRRIDCRTGKNVVIAQTAVHLQQRLLQKLIDLGGIRSRRIG